MRETKRKFTVVELLMVIAVILILAGILIPVISRAQDRGRMSVCKNNLKQIGMAIHMYADDNKSLLPNSERLGISEVMISYVEEPEIFQCPSDSGGDIGLYKDFSTSYEWNTLINGRLIDNTNFRIVDLNIQMPMLIDGEFFHDESKHFIYSDLHIETKFKSDEDD